MKFLNIIIFILSQIAKLISGRKKNKLNKLINKIQNAANKIDKENNKIDKDVEKENNKIDNMNDDQLLNELNKK